MAGQQHLLKYEYMEVPRLVVGRIALISVFGLLVLGVVGLGVRDLAKSQGSDLVDPGLSGEERVKALRALTPEQQNFLQAREEKRLKAEPMDQAALNNLSILGELAGNTAKAKAFAQESATRTLRDTQAQLSVANDYATRQDFVKVMYHLDSVLTAEPGLRDKLFVTLLQLMQNDNSTEQLAKTLNRPPVWRKEFLTWLNTEDHTGYLAFKLFNMMRKQGGAATGEETQAYIKTLIDRKEFDRAYFVWLDSLNENELRQVGNVFDGGFDLEPQNRYFDWTVYPFPNGQIGLVSRTEASKDRVLRLSFYNSIAMFGHVFQYLHLAPGSYRIEGEETARNFRTTGGLRFAVSCGDGGKVLGVGPVFRESAPWKSFSADFEVPPSGCASQILRLQSGSSAVLDVKMDGEVFIDNIKVEPADPGSQQQN